MVSVLGTGPFADDVDLTLVTVCHKEPTPFRTDVHVAGRSGAMGSSDAKGNSDASE
jgi:hypothetical protein